MVVSIVVIGVRFRIRINREKKDSGEEEEEKLSIIKLIKQFLCVSTLSFQPSFSLSYLFVTPPLLLLSQSIHISYRGHHVDFFHCKYNIREELYHFSP